MLVHAMMRIVTVPQLGADATYSPFQARCINICLMSLSFLISGNFQPLHTPRGPSQGVTSLSCLALLQVRGRFRLRFFYLYCFVLWWTLRPHIPIPPLFYLVRLLRACSHLTWLPVVPNHFFELFLQPCLSSADSLFPCAFRHAFTWGNGFLWIAGFGMRGRY